MGRSMRDLGIAPHSGCSSVGLEKSPVGVSIS